MLKCKDITNLSFMISPSMPRHTKIISTLGPASSDRDTISALIEAGTDVGRLNFSHGDHETHRTMVATVREEAAKQDR